MPAAEIPYVVTYNGISPWGQGAGHAVPYVSLEVQEVYAAGQVGFIRSVTLNGTIPSGGVSQIDVIRNAFVSNFKAFSAPNVDMPVAIVQDITFASQNYQGKVDYTITLKDFSGYVYGVSEPVDDIQFIAEQDGSVSVSHKLSAVGIPTDNSPDTAFANARSFVWSRTGISHLTGVGTSFISESRISNMFLVSQQENINRVLGSYGITEIFKYDPLHDTTSGVFKRFTVAVDSGIGSDYVQVNVNGAYSVGSDVWASTLSTYVGASAPSELAGIANAAVPGLNPLPLSLQLDQESVSQASGTTPYARTVTAKATFDNSPSASFFDYDIEAQTDHRVKVTTINLRGTIVGSGRHVRRRYQSAFDFYNNLMGGWDSSKNYAYNACVSGVSSLGYLTFTVNPTPKSFSVVHNSGQGTISVNATFDDAPFVPGYLEFNWNIATDCGLNMFRPYASANKNGGYLVQDLSVINRTSVDLTANFAYSITGVFTPTKAAGLLVYLKSLEGTQNAFLESESYNKSSGDAVRTGFNVSYTKDGKNVDALPTDGRIFAGISV